VPEAAVSLPKAMNSKEPAVNPFLSQGEEGKRREMVIFQLKMTFIKGCQEQVQQTAFQLKGKKRSK